MDRAPRRWRLRSGWLPRARGDGPARELDKNERDQAPPRSRGWTHEDPGDDAPAPGSPALAGMDPEWPWWLTIANGLPRARGDGPTDAGHRTGPDQAPPRSRGWTGCFQPRFLSFNGSPALAGMDPSLDITSSIRHRLPRARGDGPSLSLRCSSATVAPPRSRGWTLQLSRWPHEASGSPALAGMDPSAPSTAANCTWLPRARGDGREEPARARRRRLAPPRSRGWTEAASPRLQDPLGSPALAGMDRPRAGGSRGCRRLPRARGDGPGHHRVSLRHPGAPPRSRGWDPRGTRRIGLRLHRSPELTHPCS